MQTHIINSALSIALGKAAITIIEAGKKHKAIDLILSSIDRKQNEIKRNDWNANLSFKTYNILKNQGILI